MTMISVPYNKLKLSEKQQARQSGVTPESLKPLAATIKAVGLLQNMVVVKGKRGIYEVVAGGRRWAAIGMLVMDGHFAANEAFEVKLIKDEHGLLASIVENIERAPMNAADEFEAFARLIDQGLSIEDVAATFNEDEKLIRQRLKLARVAPALVQAFREGQIKLAALMAFTLSDDQERQLTVWQGLNEWQRDNPNVIRSLLTESKVTAANRVARFVGLQAYQQAGGAVVQDLFTDGDRGVYLEQPQLLHELALTKLRELADTIVQRDGWAWADVALEIDHENLRRFGRVHPSARKLTADEKRQMKALQKQYDELTERMEAQEDDPDGDDDVFLQLDMQRDEVAEQMASIEDATNVYSAESKRLAGVILCIDHDGKVKIHEGLIRPEDRQKVVQAQSEREASGEEEQPRMELPGPVTRPVHSERLVRQLTANKTGIAAAALLGQPHVALAVLAAQLGDTVLGSGFGGLDAVKISITPNGHKIRDAAPDFEGSPAHKVLDDHRRHWLDELPKDEDGELLPILPWALQQDTATLVDFLAVCVSSSLDGVQFQEHHGPTSLDVIAQHVQLDVAQWWTPTAASYLSMVNKDRIVEVVSEVCGAISAAPLAKLKKGEAAVEAEKLLAGKGWIPEMLRVRPPAPADEEHPTQAVEHADAE